MASCFDCHTPYDAARFPDLIIETWAWIRISPTGDEGGLLCPNCISGRLYIEGIKCLSCFTSGPLAVAEDPPWLLKERLLRLERRIAKGSSEEGSLER